MRRRRGSVVMIVMWAIAVAAIFASSLQLFAFRQSRVGFQRLHEVEARWAARAGVENAIAIMGLHTEDPIPDDAFAIVRDLDAVSFADLGDATYSVLHHANGFDLNGPLDEHSKINFNRGDFPTMELLEDMSPDQMAAIIDWTDEDDEPQLFGAESDYYLASGLYEPRNGPLRSLAELELVAGVWSDFVRGEDLDLDGRRDPNEDDRDQTLPEDDGDGRLEAEWSEVITVSSLDDGPTDSGLPRIHLRRADALELEDRLGVDAAQAEVLIAFGRNPENQLLQLVGTPLGNIGADGSVNPNPVNEELPDLDDEQLAAVLAECRMEPLHVRNPGRVNINTASPDLVRDMLELRGFEDSLVDEILYLRTSRPEGITSLVQFRDLRGEVTPQLVEQLASMFDVRSAVYRLAVKGRSSVSGTEVEIVVLVDRSTLPVRILEYREQ